MFKWIKNKRKDEDKRRQSIAAGDQNEDFPEKMSKENIEILRWERQARRDARQEVVKGQGVLKISSPEEQMKRLSERMAREAQQRRETHN